MAKPELVKGAAQTGGDNSETTPEAREMVLRVTPGTFKVEVIDGDRVVSSVEKKEQNHYTVNGPLGADFAYSDQNSALGFMVNVALMYLCSQTPELLPKK